MSLELSYNDHYDNHAEGWGVFHSDLPDSPFQIQNISEDNTFKDDEEVVKFVVEKALDNPYGRHAKAVRFLIESSPNEVDSFIRGVVGTNTVNLLLEKLNTYL
jgi:hypothetical protein